MFSEDGVFPCVLLVVDEVQQFIGDKVQRAMDVQEIAEHCCTRLHSRLLLVGTGQSALTGTANLGRLQARFQMPPPPDIDSFVGKLAIVQEHRAPGSVGRVGVRGATWSARNTSDVTLTTGQRARVAAVDGLLLAVVPE